LTFDHHPGIAAKREGGDPVIVNILLDSGSPLRCGRNDVIDCPVNKMKRTAFKKYLTAEHAEIAEII
jgi:hypothetical protein